MIGNPSLGGRIFLVLLAASFLHCGSVMAGDSDVAERSNRSSSRLQRKFDQTVAPFLREFCLDCHGSDEQKGDRRFDMLPAEIADDAVLVDYQDVVDQLNLGEMPPDDGAQPSEKQRREVVRWMSSRLSQYHEAHKGSGGQTVLRRLNAREYRNTVRDLLHLDITMFDPTRRFPRDQSSEHLDNVGETLVTSGHLLARYLEAAELVIDKAIALGRSDHASLVKPKVQTWSFHDGFDQQPEIDQVHRKTTKFKHLVLFDVIGADKHEGAYAPIHAFADGVPIDGFYEIRFTADAVNREHPYDPEFLGTDPSEPLRMGIVAGNHHVGSLHLPQPVEPLLAELELADGKKDYTVRVWLDAGYTPRFTFRNGLMDARNLWSKLIRKYPDQFPKSIGRGIVSARFNAIKFGKLPQIHIDDIEIRGPLMDQWPTASQRALLGDETVGLEEVENWDEQTLRRRIGEFATRAYRRPVTEDEVDRVMAVVEARRNSGRTSIQAWGDGLKTILCSPNFLYLDESGDTALSDHSLASRLSYFLWSSMPDRELLDLAASGDLSDESVLRKQVSRMLADPKSDAFIDGFLGSWLGLRDLGSTPPDRGAFRDFYHHDLDSAMRRETFLFTRYLVDENLGARNFLDSDFTFVNKPLARLYDMEPSEGYQFEKVAIRDSRRGGLLGQASILTLSANGIDTSPVVRGVWLLENLLGTPPSPPPPDVEPLDPDVRGAKSIREQLDRHRSDANCYDCHRKIDPLGFAMENFDPIGRWRTSYGRGVEIDSSGELPGGKKFEDVVGLKAILSDQVDLFAAALTRKLLAYAIGRHVEASDRPAIDAILQSTVGDEYRLQDLIVQVVLSEPFRTP